MSTVNPSPDTNTSALAAAANFLLSLNAGLGGDNSKGDLFSQYLLQSNTSGSQGQAQNQTPAVTSSSATTPATQTQQTNNGNSDGDTTSTPVTSTLPALKKLVSTWKYLVQKLQAQTTGKPVASKTDTTKQTQNSANTQQSNGSFVAANTTTPAQAQGTFAVTDTNSDDSDTDTGNDSQTISDILKELQMLSLLIEKQLMDLQKSGTTTAGTTDTTTASIGATDAAGAALPTDPAQILADLTAALDPSLGQALGAGTSTDAGSTTTAADPSSTTATTPSLTQALTDMLTLVQLVTKQLGGTPASSDLTASTDANTQVAAASTSGNMPTDAQLQADLKVLIDNLRGSAAPQSSTNTSTADAAAATSTIGTFVKVANKVAANAQLEVASEIASGNDTSNQDTTPNIPAAAPDAARTAWMQHDDFLNLFKVGNNSSSSQTPTDAKTDFTNAVTTATAGTVDNSGKNDPSLDLNLNSQDSDTGSQANARMAAGINNNSSTLDNNLSTNVGGSSVTSPYSFASQLSETRAATGGTTGLPDAVEQVILQLNRNVKTGNDQMSLQLNPADLGRVDIKLSIASDGKVQGTVVADNPSTLHLLLKDVRGLERALQDAGLRADPGSLQFSLGDPGNSSGQTAQNQYANTGNGGNASSNLAMINDGGTDMVSDLSSVSSDTSDTYYLTPNRVNLQV
ncbi:MAG TPA: flagellar hook-length control protein FliK [Alphaproteobacteria bacterium]|nr:flagellar hook-length control protein FliK [Alphaproteobacteria bacterium]